MVFSVPLTEKEGFRSPTTELLQGAHPPTLSLPTLLTSADARTAADDTSQQINVSHPPLLKNPTTKLH